MSYKDEVLKVFPDGYADDHVDIVYEGTVTEFCVISATSPDDEDQRAEVTVLGKPIPGHPNARRPGMVARLDEPVDLRDIPEEAFERAWRESQV